MDGMTTSINSILKNLIKNFNTLLDCPVRYSGEFNEQKIHCFVEYIERYKQIKCIRDEQALQELQYLLLDHAYDWWMRRKAKIETWSEALAILENQFSKKRPANVVYLEILRHPFEDYQSKDDFIDDKIELFAELSQPDLTAKTKLEIIYAILPDEVQKKIKFEDISSFKDLKNHLKLVEPVRNNVPSAQENIILNPETTSVLSVGLAETSNSGVSNKDSVSQMDNNDSTEKSINTDHGKDSLIKVRRTEDLMPQEVKEEEKSSEEFIAIKAESSATNNRLHISHDNFQIDSDIMNQINNIIDETEMNIAAINNNVVASTTSQTSNSVISLELLGFEIETAKQNESEDRQSKSPVNSTRKTKQRHSNHTAQACIKRAKHMSFPERFTQTISGESFNSLDETNNEDLSESGSTNICNSNLTIINTQTTEVPVSTPNITNPTANIAIHIDPPPAVTNPTVISNNMPERNISSILTTKLIPAINGKAPNKILAAKLRNINSPTPKCHQCGTLGFYKSICPKCSPIYNNNSHK